MLMVKTVNAQHFRDFQKNKLNGAKA